MTDVIFWTEERIDILSRLWADGYSCGMIAREIGAGVTRNAVIGKKTRLKLPERPSRVALPSPAKRRRVVSAPRHRISPPEPVPAHRHDDRVIESPIIGLGTDVARLSLVELTDRTCKWPVGDPRAVGFGFCGLPSADGPYCEAHAARAYHAVPVATPRARAAA